MNSVLNNMDALNRSLESSVAVGKEFSSSADLWRNFYDGMQVMEELKHGQNEFQENEQAGEQPGEQPEGEGQDQGADEPQSQDQDVDMNPPPTDSINGDQDAVATQEDTQEDSQQN
ncbi:DASH complex subunit [Wickerhamomyces ciferrii]|uniref:DASH complex subunit DAD1 n=1 Tax=Wickerhamomyces ciferrii (strain ATCC 14091 / BCRC 22168 / CBS 111 / JCM 3599 / NBRC 0793 / NRRL Y-1031 F-60-10) TaxID=1206466 RepID=K0KNL7_WICCF|nr:DASH complex subunit [Wickerhamomyces ciferrii]CCH42713.1 DASH complex subunit [Wickerhamomyces ciferrii]